MKLHITSPRCGRTKIAQRFITGIRSLNKSQPAKESVGESRRDAMFIEKLEPIDLGEPIYGRTIVGCAPKGATTSQLCLSFYTHFTATRFFRRTPSESGWRICASSSLSHRSFHLPTTTITNEPGFIVRVGRPPGWAGGPSVYSAAGRNSFFVFALNVIVIALGC